MSFTRILIFFIMNRDIYHHGDTNGINIHRRMLYTQYLSGLLPPQVEYEVCLQIQYILNGRMGMLPDEISAALPPYEAELAKTNAD